MLVGGIFLGFASSASRKNFGAGLILTVWLAYRKPTIGTPDALLSSQLQVVGDASLLALFRLQNS